MDRLKQSGQDLLVIMPDICQETPTTSSSPLSSRSSGSSHSLPRHEGDFKGVTDYLFADPQTLNQTIPTSQANLLYNQPDVYRRSNSSCSSPCLCTESPPVVMPSCRELAYNRNDESVLGLWNLGNTCYANSVLQALYRCKRFRQGCVEELGNCSSDGWLGLLGNLFLQLGRSKRLRKPGHVNPTKFIGKLRECNDIFRSPEHHDAHEFYSFLLNEIQDELLKRRAGIGAASAFKYPFLFKLKINDIRRKTSDSSSSAATFTTCFQNLSGEESGMLACPCLSQPLTWLDEIFQGYLVCETRCLFCENISRRQEPFFDIPIDVREHMNPGTVRDISWGILNFAKTEFLQGKNKYACDICGCRQEAERRVRFQHLPRVLTIHLKRFTFDENAGNYIRVSDRMAFPVSFPFPKDALSQSSLTSYIYNLFAVVVHVGTSMSHGHYISCVRSKTGWWILDDHSVKATSEAGLESFFGSPMPLDGLRCGYLLFYELDDFDATQQQKVPVIKKTSFIQRLKKTSRVRQQSPASTPGITVYDICTKMSDTTTTTTTVPTSSLPTTPTWDSGPLLCTFPLKPNP